MSSAKGPPEAEEAASENLQKRMWMKYYCEDCKAWETRELFETKVDVRGVAPGPSALWSWGCSKVIHYGSFQKFRVEKLNSADGHDAPNCGSSDPVDRDASPAQPADEQAHPGRTQAEEEIIDRQPHDGAAQSNGSLPSKRTRRHTRPSNSLPEAASPNSQGGVTSSSHHALPDENGASLLDAKNGSLEGEVAAEAAGTESPAVIDAERLESVALKRPRRLTAGDRGFAQALQYEKESQVTTKPLAKASIVTKPAEPAPAAVRRPKRVTAGLQGLVLSVENSYSAPRLSVAEPKTELNTERQQAVGPRANPRKMPRASRKNRKLGDLY